jgi:hypothetical protein
LHFSKSPAYYLTHLISWQSGLLWAEEPSVL